MGFLALGIVLFFLAHGLPMMSIQRDRLVARLGAGPYKMLFSLVSLAGLGLMIYGMATGPFLPGYAHPAWGQYATLALMPLAFILLVAAYVPSNIKRWTVHPMTLGILVWAGAHLLSNGDRMSAMLFGSFTIYALVNLLSQVARPQPARVAPQPWSRDALVVAIGLVLMLIMTGAHHILFGVSALPWLFGAEPALPSLSQ
ncbi:NnrU family protein [Roseospira visakhapatnamensis]|uniref:Putative membrane protein n=1 Tax=Roseospira visakhapatnamensis TaxID=390880 RepID=A0A7W6RBD9_9PROT|nr:NnrU family protein [Roseospira visakhapatnamensis]MBB4265389.1 putative membrane protein [Roseospira visakhapatnamensis]